MLTNPSCEAFVEVICYNLAYCMIPSITDNLMVEVSYFFQLTNGKDAEKGNYSRKRYFYGIIAFTYFCNFQNFCFNGMSEQLTTYNLPSFSAWAVPASCVNNHDRLRAELRSPFDGDFRLRFKEAASLSAFRLSSFFAYFNFLSKFSLGLPSIIQNWHNVKFILINSVVI